MKVLVPLADGFEEIEAVSIIDVLRRADLEVVVAGLVGRDVTGSHGLMLRADVVLRDFQRGALGDFDGMVLPGGMPGASSLRDDAAVIAGLVELAAAGKLVAAICAAPIALAKAGLLDGIRATAYPAFRDQLGGAEVVHNQGVVVSGKVVTSAGPGTAIDFSLQLVAMLAGADVARRIAAEMLCPEPALYGL